MKLIKYLFVGCALLFSCQKDSSTEFVQETEGISLEEAKSFFNEQEAQKKAQGNTFALEPLWETFAQGGENNNREPFAYADVVVNEKFDAKLVFAKKAESLRSIVSFSPKSKKTLVISDQRGTIQEIYYIKKDSSLNVMTKMSNSLQLSASYRSSCPRNNCDGTECEKKYCSCECHSNNDDSRPTTDHISNIDPETGQYMGGGGFADIYLSEVVVVGNRNKNRGGSSYLPIYNPPSPDRFLNNFGYTPYKNGSLFDINEIDKGGGGGGSSSNTKADDKIDDKQLKPCMQKIVDDLKKLSKGVNSLIKKFAGNTPKFNWEMIDGSLPINGTGTTNPPAKYNHSTGTITSTFDSQQWEQATELSWARTILHEAVHANLAVQFAIDKPNWIATYPQMVQEWGRLQNWNSVHHEEMARSIVKDIAIALEEYGISKGYKLSKQFYEDMAWGGLENTSSFQNLPQSDRVRIKNIIVIELTGKDNYGTSRKQEGKPAGC